MKYTSVKQNAILNVIRSLLAVLFPIITYPYAARVVGVVNIGKVNYIASFITYFTIFAMFGIDTFGVRECASVRDDRERASVLASRLWSYSLLTTVISLIGLGLLTFIYIPLHSYVPVILIQSLMIIFTTVGADWINVVYEDYTYTTLRGITINIINMVILFVFVHRPEDYLIYAFLTVSSVVLGGIVNIFRIRKFVTLRLSSIPDIRETSRRLMPFLVNDMSIAVYVGMDMTILGIMHGDYRVGVYSAAVKIYTMVKTVFIAIFSVTLARLSAHIAAGEREEFRKLVSGVTSVFMMLAFPAMIGLILYAEPVILLIAGPEYYESPMSLRLLALALVFAAFGGIATRCANVPLGFERVNTFATIFAAIENTVLNIPMIYFFRETGAAITTILAELSVLIICMINFRHNGIKWSSVVTGRDLRDTLCGVAGIAILYPVVRFLFKSELLVAIAGMILSVFLYFCILILMKNKTVASSVCKVLRKAE